MAPNAGDRVGRWRARWDRLRALGAVHWGWRAIVEIGDNNVFGLASQLAYGFLFALFPFLLCIVALTSFLPIHGVMSKLLYELSAFVPEAGYQLIQKNLTDIIARKHPGLISVAFVVGLWSTSGAITSLITGLNQVYGVNDHRSVLKTRGLALVVALAADLLAVLTSLLVIGGGSAGRFVSGALGAPALYSEGWRLLRWPAASALLLGALVVLYWVLPDVKLRARDVFWGALVAVGAWVLATLGFSYFLGLFPNFGATYGSLATVIVLLTWLWINGLLLILGGQVNALIAEAHGFRPERRRSRSAAEVH